MRKRPEPKLATPLQYSVLRALLGTDAEFISGLEIRKQLGTRGFRKDGPAFYMLMARMEETKLISSKQSVKVVDGQTIREKLYKIRAGGGSLWSTTREFFR